MNIQGVFRIDEGGNAPLFLCLCHGVEGQGRFSGSFRTVDFDDPSARESAHTEGEIQCQRSSWNRPDIRQRGLATEFHDGPFSVLSLDLRHGQINSLLPFRFFHS